MPKTVSRTFRIPADIAVEIEVGAKKNNVSQAQYITTVVTENKFLKLRKSFEDDLRVLEKDELYKHEQVDLAEADFL